MHPTLPLNQILTGDCRELLKTLPDESVHCVVTSPPYWGLRSYGTDPQVWQNGHEPCVEHTWITETRKGQTGGNKKVGLSGGNDWQDAKRFNGSIDSTCSICGAWRGELGLEPTPELFCEHLTQIFREVRRVLRDDGTLWLNLASSYSSGIIESQNYIIRRDFDAKTRLQIAQALSAVWSGHESAESALSKLLVERTPETRKLPEPELSEVRKAVQSPHHANTAGTGEILLSQLRSVGEPNPQEVQADSDLPNLRQEIRQVPSGDQEEQGQQTLLQPRVLVQLQPEGQPLPLDGRAARPNESRRHKVAHGSSKKRQVLLSDLPREQETRSPSYSPLLDSPSGAVASEQRDNVVSRLPCQDETPRIRLGGNAQVHSIYSGYGLENLSFPKTAVPQSFLPLCQPEHIWKPKDLVDTPAMVVDALRRDGWYYRSDCIWAKPNPMPESVTDRPTKAHEYIFLLSKSHRYYYDADAVREPMSEATKERDKSKFSGAFKGQFRGTPNENRWQDGRPIEEPHFYNEAGRNRRSVWTVPTAPFKGAHFATFPPKLIEPCILAGCPVDGVVLDPFIGSGTTASVCVSLKRNYIGFDLNPQYVEGLAQDRADNTPPPLFVL